MRSPFLLISQQRVEVSRSNLELARSFCELARKKFEAGAAPRLDVLSAEIQLSAAEQALLSAQASLEQAQAQIRPLLGEGKGRPIVASGSVQLPRGLSRFDERLAGAAATHPQVEMARRALEQSEALVKLGRAQFNPTPSIVYFQDLRYTNLNAYQAQLQFPIDWGGMHANVRQAQETVEERRAALTQATLDVEARISTARSGYESALQTADAFEARVVRPSEELVRLTELGYRRGALPYLQMLNAQQNLLQARAQHLALLLAGHQALHALEAASAQNFEEEPTR